MSSGKRSIDQVNRAAAASDDKYIKTDLGINAENEETANVISSTFGVIKNSLDALWYSVGLEPNVNVAYEKTMMDPSLCIEAMGRRFYPHPGVGTLKAYNDSGNPSGGCFSMQTLA